MIKPTLIVMAAGMGSRYGGIKQMDKFGPSGEAIIDYSVYDAIRAGFGKVVFVIRKSFEADFREFIGTKFADKISIEYAFQEIDALPQGVTYNPERAKPWGTGHAVLMTADLVKEPFVVINGDDFYGAEAFQSIADYFRSNTNQNYCMVGYVLENTLSEHGYVSRGVCKVDAASYLDDINECTQIQREGETIVYLTENKDKQTLKADTIVSMNFWGFYPSLFEHLKSNFEVFIRENASNLKAEFYLPALVNKLIKEGITKAKVITTDSQWFGVTYKEDKEMVISKLQKLVADGVYPKSLW